MVKWSLLLCGIFISVPGMAMESTKPPHPITTPQIAVKVLKQLTKNSHVRVIGTCFWLNNRIVPKVTPGPAISQFVPDLVVTVSNNPGENPWMEANALYENKGALKLYQSAFTSVMQMPLGFGDGSGQLALQHINEDRTRVVSVMGSPSDIYQIKGVTHLPETSFMKLYYSSLADAVNERTESGEIAYMATHPLLLINHEIGSAFNSWGPEIPRLMRVTQPSRFKASVVAALHAADIVTNRGVHLKQSTKNDCGSHCVVANVVFDARREHIIWQEVYPNNRNITPGDSSDSGVKDDVKGNGNYVFVVWRQYKGCVKQEGKLIWGPDVGTPQKR